MPAFDRAVVERIKSLDATRCECALAQGDDIGRLIPVGDDEAHNGSQEAFDALARETGIAAQTLRARRYVSSRVPLDMRLSTVAWSAYQALAGVADEEARRRFLAQIKDTRATTTSGRWTLDAVLGLLDREPTHKPVYTLANATPEEKLEAYRRLVDDPAILDAIAKGLLEGAAKPSTDAQALEEARREATAARRMQQTLQRSLDEALATLKVLREEVERLKKTAPKAKGEGEGENDPEAEARRRQKGDPVSQWMHASQALHGLVSRFDAPETAEAVLGSRLDTDIQVGFAERGREWLGAFVAGLRSPRRLRVVGATSKSKEVS